MRKLRYMWCAQPALQGGILWQNNSLALVAWQNNSAAIIAWLATMNAAYVNVPTNTVLVTAQPPTATVASGGVSDFYPGGTRPDGVVVAALTVTDPFSAYPTWYLDGSTGVDPVVGSHQSVGYIYRTLQAAMVDVFYTSGLGARRIIVRPTATYTTMGAGSDSHGLGMGYFMAGGSGPSAQYVVQGDPSSSTLPVFDNGISSTAASGNNFIAIGSNGNGGNLYTPSYITVRKLQFRNNGADCFYFYNGQSNFVTIEYCSFHDIWYPLSNPSSSGAVGITNTSNNTTNNLTFRFNNCYTWQNPNGSPNSDVVGSYGSDFVTIQNCYFNNCYAAFRSKEWNNGTGPTTNNLTIANNIFSSVYNCIATAPNQVPQTAIAFSNATISNNLSFGNWQGNGSSLVSFNIGQPFGTQGTGNLISNNTANGTGGDISMPFSTGTVVRDNLCISASGSHTQTYAGTPYGTTFSQFDYNVYGGAALWTLQNAVAYPHTPANSYASFAAWQAAAGVPEFSTPPDANGKWIPSLSVSWNTIAKNLPNYLTGDYTIAAGSPLLTASSTGGRVGCDTSNLGPGWFA